MLEVSVEGFSTDDVKVSGNFISHMSLFPVDNPNWFKVVVIGVI